MILFKSLIIQLGDIRGDSWVVGSLIGLPVPRLYDLS